MSPAPSKRKSLLRFSKGGKTRRFQKLNTLEIWNNLFVADYIRFVFAVVSHPSIEEPCQDRT
jgi:hypothetical protein